jgi:hypothetical protein
MGGLPAARGLAPLDMQAHSQGFAQQMAMAVMATAQAAQQAAERQANLAREAQAASATSERMFYSHMMSTSASRQADRAAVAARSEAAGRNHQLAVQASQQQANQPMQMQQQTFLLHAQGENARIAAAAAANAAATREANFRAGNERREYALMATGPQGGGCEGSSETGDGEG